MVHKEIERIIGTSAYGMVNVTDKAKDLQEGQMVFMFQRENVDPIFIWCQIPIKEHTLSSACCKDLEHLSYAITPTAAIVLVIEKIVSRPSH